MRLIMRIEISIFCIWLMIGMTSAGFNSIKNVTVTGDMLLNDETFANTNTYLLLVIAPEQFSTHLQTLVLHKESLGVTAKLVTLEEIYGGVHFPAKGRDDAERIKYFIKDAVEQWRIEYVLFVGGRKPSLLGEDWWLPVRYSHIEDNVATHEDSYISDLYFADIYDSTGAFSSWDTNSNNVFSEWLAGKPADDIMDLYPDVSLGRLPCRNDFEVGIMVDKIIAYESNQRDESWFKKMVVIGGDTYTDNDYFEGEVANQEALDMMDGFEAVRLWTSDGSLGGWQDVIRTVNEGCGFLYFAGHGSPTSWATHPPYDDGTWVYGLQTFQMPLLSNGDKLPICVVGGCHNSMFNISFFNSAWTFGLPVYECWSWRLTHCIRGGSIATLGCTGLGYGKEDKIGFVKEGAGDWLNTLFFSAYDRHNALTLGDAWARAITMYLDEFPIDYTQVAFADTALDSKTVQEWVLIGDPSLDIGGRSYESP